MSSTSTSFSLIPEEITPDGVGLPQESSFSALKAMLFSVETHTFALPMISVLKVLSCPPNLASQVDQLGIFYLGQAAIKLLYPLQSTLSPESYSTEPFLMVFQAQANCLYAIAVPKVPDITELPLSAFQPLPEIQTRQGLFKFVSYVALMPETENFSSQIYLLDLQQIAQA